MINTDTYLGLLSYNVWLFKSSSIFRSCRVHVFCFLTGMDKQKCWVKIKVSISWTLANYTSLFINLTKIIKEKQFNFQTTWSVLTLPLGTGSDVDKTKAAQHIFYQMSVIHVIFCLDHLHFSENSQFLCFWWLFFCGWDFFFFIYGASTRSFTYCLDKKNADLYFVVTISS